MKALVLLLILTAPVAFADNKSYITYGPEYVTGVDNRSRPQVAQPVGDTVVGKCQKPLPAEQSWQANLGSVTCGEGAVSKDRAPIPMDPNVADMWDLYTHAGSSRRDDAQNMRKLEIVWNGVIDYPMYESWVYQQKVGDYADRCGKNWYTTCAQDGTEHYDETTMVCDQWEDPPAQNDDDGGSGSTLPPVSGGSGARDNSGSDYHSPYKNSQPAAPKGGGESQKELKKSYQDKLNKYKNKSKSVNPYNEPKIHEASLVFIYRDLAQERKCIHKSPKVEHLTRSAPRKEYSCTSHRPKWCEWFVSQPVTRRCDDQHAKYTLKYAHDDNWKPGYADPKDSMRNYHDYLPNKFDLLTGETEQVYIFANTGINSVLNPTATFSNAWNEYRVKSNPTTLSCAYNSNQEINLIVETIGRLKRKAPNPLAVPKDENGKENAIAKFDPHYGQGHSKPELVVLRDTMREAQMDAARMSRQFPRPQGAPQADGNSIYKKDNSGNGAAATKGYWAQTHFKIQLYRYDSWNRPVRITVPDKFNSNQVSIMSDRVSMQLENGTIPNMYQPGGPFESIMGSVYKRFGVELTPNTEYTIKVQSVTQGFPWYENGCKDDKANCVGEEVSKDAYSDPVLIKWKTDPEIERSWLKKIRDYQEKHMWF